MVIQASHLDGYQVGVFAVGAENTASAYWTEVSSHLITAIGDHGMSFSLPLDFDIPGSKIGVGGVAGSGGFLAIQAVTLNHPPGFVADGQGDCTASAAPCSKRLVGHKAFFSGTVGPGCRCFSEIACWLQRYSWPAALSAR